jgi:oxygen-dependent protoporphyrinogen oxidase
MELLASPSPGDERPHVVVVGGGIAGLAAAYRLTRLEPPVAVTLVEASPRLGGKIVTERADGFAIEGGPDSFLSAKPRGIGLCRELGLEHHLQGTTPRRRRAFVLRRGRLHDLPEGLSGLVPTRLGPMLRSGLVSPRGKARLALDYVLPPRRDDEDEALGAFVRRRLGREVYENLVEPLMAGIYAGDGERLSLAATFPQLRDGERAHGGLIRGVLAAKRRGAASGVGPGARPAFVAPQGGMATLVEALAERLETAGVRTLLGAEVGRIDGEEGPRSGRYRVRLAGGEEVAADAVVVATPAFVAADLVAGIDPSLATELASIPHASSAIVSLAYPRDVVTHPLDGHGYVIPRVEGRAALACTWTSAKWARRAPDGFVLLRVFVGRFGRDEAVAGSDETLIRLARDEVGDTLGIAPTPSLTRVHRWRHGMPQYVLGHPDRLAAIERRLQVLPGLALAGNAYRGVGLPDCIASGEAAAAATHRFVSRRSAEDAVGDGAPAAPAGRLAGR